MDSHFSHAPDDPIGHGNRDATRALRRTKVVKKAAWGGPRSIDEHLNSISVKKELVKDKRIIVLDDVTTTGNSLQACQKLLHSAGATKVQKVVIAKTVFYKHI